MTNHTEFIDISIVIGMQKKKHQSHKRKLVSERELCPSKTLINPAKEMRTLEPPQDYNSAGEIVSIKLQRV